MPRLYDDAGLTSWLVEYRAS